MPRIEPPNATGYIRTVVPLLTVPVYTTVLGANTAVTFLTSFVPGFCATVEEFGFIVSDVLTGAGGTLSFDLKNGSTVIATVTITLALGAAGAVIKTGTITAPADLGDLSALSIAREATGTAFTAGTGVFYVRLRQLPQTAAA
jgi:hypothetical protein